MTRACGFGVHARRSFDRLLQLFQVFVKILLRQFERVAPNERPQIVGRSASAGIRAPADDHREHAIPLLSALATSFRNSSRTSSIRRLPLASARSTSWSDDDDQYWVEARMASIAFCQSTPARARRRRGIRAG